MSGTSTHIPIAKCDYGAHGDADAPLAPEDQTALKNQAAFKDQTCESTGLDAKSQLVQDCAFDDFLTGERMMRAFAPGRTELAGNHVDHQGGVVMAASISLGTTGYACENGSDLVRVESVGFDPFTVDLTELRATSEPLIELFGTSKSLVAGMIVALEKWAATGAASATEASDAADAASLEIACISSIVRGFDLKVIGELPAGGGLSSSASFELMVGCILNAMFFGERFSALELAQAAQEAESRFFGKPCGLMDQASIAFGGVTKMDFTTETPQVMPVSFDFSAAGLSVILVDVHADHAAATPEYAAIPRDMSAAARLCGAERLGEVEEATLLARLGDIRRILGDMAALRSLHYVREVNLVRSRAAALTKGDVAGYCQATAFSAASSAQYLQNVSELGASQQPAMLALALADLVLDNMAAEDNDALGPATRGAWPRGVARIHGGGFGGSIQVYIPSARAEEFAHRIDAQLGEGSATILTITNEGAHASWM